MEEDLLNKLGGEGTTHGHDNFLTDPTHSAEPMNIKLILKSNNNA